MKLKIDNEVLADSFFENSRLMGIVAPLKDYVFTWLVNQHLGFDFRLNNSLEIQLIKKKRDYFFSVFQCNVRGSSLVHYIYNNQFDGEYLLPEFKHLDFLWLIKEEYVPDDELGELISGIRALPGVQLVSEMTADKIRHKQHLIL